MRHLSDTVQRLARFRFADNSIGEVGATSPERLSILTDFGSNPGSLTAKFYCPHGLKQGSPLIVVLHGCTQTADEYDDGAGWSRMADAYGFALLFPEQRRSNNANLCFNWFSPADVRRGSGEVSSIREMIEAIAVTHKIDRGRIFVNGLSAGGAMTAALLATYPEVFAGGAIIAGLPYACAETIPEAFDRMRGHGLASERELQKSLRDATDFEGPWPTISVWHGTDDKIVAPANADAIVAQWRGVHDVDAAPSTARTADGYSLDIWSGRDGRPLIERYLIAGMGHGTPIAPEAENGVGKARPFMLGVGISSTMMLLEAWKVTAPPRNSLAGFADLIAGAPAVERPGGKADAPASNPPASNPPASNPPASWRTDSIKGAVERALRAAGLLK